MNGLQTYSVYLILFFVMFSLCKEASRKKIDVLVFFAIFIYAVVFGIRYGVGVDYFAYLQEYTFMLRSPIAIQESYFEPGFLMIIRMLSFFEAHFSIFFGVIAFLQLYLVFKAVKCTPYIYPYLTFTFMIGCVWLSFGNGLRQELAFCFFIFSLIFVEKRSLLMHYLCIALAISMHNSAIILLPFYFILQYKKEWFLNVKIQIIAFFIAFLLGNINIIQNYLVYLEGVFSFLEYDNYLDDRYADKLMNLSIQKGIGFYVILSIDILLVTLSNRYKKYFENFSYVKLIYNFYFIGVLLKYSFLYSQLIQRVNYYFYGFQFIVASYVLYYLSKNNKKMFLILLFLYVLLFIGTLSKMEDNTSLYRFFWEVY